MNVRLVSAAATLATASAAPAAIAPDSAADAVASFADTLDRSRQSLADGPTKADGAATSASGRELARSALRSSDDSAGPDPLALLLAGAAMAAHAHQAPPRTPAVADGWTDSPLRVTREVANATAHAAPQSLNLPESLGHELLAASERPGRVRHAASMDSAGERAAAPPAALARANAAGAQKTAPHSGSAPETLDASVDLVALAGRAGVHARTEAGSADSSHALSPAVAADAASALPAAAEAGAAALTTSPAAPGDGAPNSRAQSSAVAAHAASALPAAADAAAAAQTTSAAPRGDGAPYSHALSSALAAHAASALPAAADGAAAPLATLAARGGGAPNSHALSSAPAAHTASALPAAADGAAAALATLAARGGGAPNSHALSSAPAAHAASALPAAADGAAAALATSAPPGGGGAANERQPAREGEAHTMLSATLAAAPSPTNGVLTRPADTQGTVAPPVGSSEWAPALAQQIAHLAPGRSQIELELHPAELGPLTVKLTVGAAQAQVMFLSEHAAVRQALEAALPQLRTTLADSGISLGEASVGGGAGGQASGQHDRRDSATQRDTPPRAARTAAAEPLASVRLGSTPGLDAFA